MRPRRLAYVRVLGFVALTVLLASCGDTGLFFPVADQQARVEVLTVDPGTVLAPSDTVTIEIVFDGEALDVDRMTIDLASSDGTVLFSQELGADEIQLLPMPLELPEDLATGRYTLKIALYNLDELVAQRESEFYVAAEPYEITGFVSYPGILYPGGSGLVTAGLNIPDGSDPYLRWRASGDIIGEGYLSEGADSIEVEVPDREGVFSLVLELFPVGSDHSGVPDPEVLSSDRLEAQLFVSTDQPSEPHELGPAENYTSLFHFRGETIDYGRNGTNVPLQFVGKATLGIADGSFGFSFAPETSLVIDHSLFPFGTDGLHAFSFSLRLVPYEYGTVLSIDDHDDGATFAQFDFDANGAPGLRLGTAVSRIDTVQIPLNETVEITVSVVPEDGGIRFLWFVSGLSVGEQFVETDNAVALPRHPYTTIGGERFSALIDELGVFSVESEAVDSSVFSRAMRLEYGSDLLLAEGFDGLEFPDGLTVTGEEGGASVVGGAAVLESGTQVSLPPIPIDFESLRIEIATSSGDISVDALIDLTSSPSSERVVRYDTGTGYISPSDEVVAPPLEVGPIRIDLSLQEDTVQLLADNRVSDLLVLPYTDSSLVVTIGATGSEPFSIDSILVTKNQIEQQVGSS